MSKQAKKAPVVTPERATELTNRSSRQRDKVAAIVAKTTAPKPDMAKASPRGGGSAIGVAKGAMDGQPHTKLAVEQARKRERAEAAQAGQVQARDMGGNLVYVDPKSKLLYDGKLFPNASLMSAYKLEQARTAKKVKPAEPKAERKMPTPPPAADRKYAKGAKAIEAKPGSWREYMLKTIQAYKSTDAAKAAHLKSGQFVGAKLDFGWAGQQGYIVWEVK